MLQNFVETKTTDLKTKTNTGLKTKTISRDHIPPYDTVTVVHTCIIIMK